MEESDTSLQLSHEVSLIKSFIIKERQQRYLDLLSTPKGRIKFRSYIAHFKDLNYQFYSELPDSINQAIGLYNLLKSNGAPEFCYIISSNSKFDKKDMLLRDALNNLFLSGIEFFMSCIPGKLAYFEGEDGRYLLQK